MGAYGDELEVLVPLGEEDCGELGSRPSARLRLPGPYGGLLRPGGLGDPAEPGPPDQAAEETTGAARAPRRRWPVVVVAALVTVVAIVVPIRDRLARRELRALEREWAQLLADDAERGSAEQHLKAYLAVADTSMVDPALASLYREEQHRFLLARIRLHSAVLVDRRLVPVRSHLVGALSHRALLFRRVADWYAHPGDGSPPVSADNETAADSARVDHDIAEVRAHYGDPEQASAPRAIRFAAVTAALGRLSRWSDQPLGALLLGMSDSRMMRLHIDASRIVPANGIAVDGEPIARRGYLAFVSNGQVWTVAPDGSGQPRVLAAAVDRIFAGSDPNTIWVEDPSTLAVTEIDGSGHRLRGPVKASIGNAVTATLSSLVVVMFQPPAIVTVSAADGHVQCRFGRVGPLAGGPFAPVRGPFAIATYGDVMAWVDTANQIHLTDTLTCAERLKVVLSNNHWDGAIGPASFSPDGHTLAVAGIPASGKSDATYTYSLDLLDMASGRVTAVPWIGNFSVASVAWTADARRLFWLSGGQFGAPATIVTWRVGDREVQVLRAIDLRLEPPLFVVP